MALEIKVPTVGESISEVVIGEWLRPEGAQVQLDDPIVSLETDKVNVDVPAPGTGVLSRIVKRQGETARVGEVIGYVDETASASTALPATKAAEAAEAAEAPAAPAKAKATEQRVMPAAARVLGEAKQDASQVKGTGPGGRVLKEDAVKHLAEGQKIPLVFAEPPAPAPVRAAPAAQTVPATSTSFGSVSTADALAPATQLKAPAPTDHRREEIVPMTPLRKRVAQRLVEAQQTAAILTTFNEVDLSTVMELRKRHQEEFTAKHGVKLGFMSFFIKASVEALKAWPTVNAQLRGADIVFQHFFDIGVAVGGGKGLVVPVLRDADQLSFAEIEKKLADFGNRAKTGKLKLEELQGGTFSISNGGVYGSMMSTPILNPPQSGILGMHNIIERPIGVAGQIVLRPMMYLALSYDHRLVDGREAVSFLISLKKSLEAPERLLLSL